MSSAAPRRLALVPGERFETPARTLSEADVEAFSVLTGDHHPQHLDAAWAARSQFGERIAHGMLVISCAVGMLELDPERVVAMRRLREVVFKRPVPVGGTVSVRGTVGEARPLGDGLALLALDLEVVDGRGRVAVRAQLEALAREPGDGS